MSNKKQVEMVAEIEAGETIYYVPNRGRSNPTAYFYWGSKGFRSRCTGTASALVKNATATIVRNKFGGHQLHLLKVE